MNKLNLNKEQFKDNNWYVSYNAYTDVLQVYRDNAFSFSDKDIVTKAYENLSIKFDVQTGKPVVFEFKNTYNTFNLDPDEVSSDRLFEAVSNVVNTYE